MLGLAAATFVAIGLLYLIAPALLNVYAGTPSAPQKTEIRAIYGGMELGVGLFFGWSLRCRQRLGPGLVLLALVLSGITAGRAVGWIVEGVIDRVNFWALVAEGLGSGFAWWAWWRFSSPQRLAAAVRRG